MEIIMIIGIILVCIIVTILTCLDKLMKKIRYTFKVNRPSRTYDWIGDDMKKFRKRNIKK